MGRDLRRLRGDPGAHLRDDLQDRGLPSDPRPAVREQRRDQRPRRSRNPDRHRGGLHRLEVPHRPGDHGRGLGSPHEHADDARRGGRRSLGAVAGWSRDPSRRGAPGARGTGRRRGRALRRDRGARSGRRPLGQGGHRRGPGRLLRRRRDGRRADVPRARGLLRATVDVATPGDQHRLSLLGRELRDSDGRRFGRRTLVAALVHAARLDRGVPAADVTATVGVGADGGARHRRRDGRARARGPARPRRGDVPRSLDAHQGARLADDAMGSRGVPVAWTPGGLGRRHRGLRTAARRYRQVRREGHHRDQEPATGVRAPRHLRRRGLPQRGVPDHGPDPQLRRRRPGERRTKRGVRRSTREPPRATVLPDHVARPTNRSRHRRGRPGWRARGARHLGRRDERSRARPLRVDAGRRRQRRGAGAADLRDRDPRARAHTPQGRGRHLRTARLVLVGGDTRAAPCARTTGSSTCPASTRWRRPPPHRSTGA